MADDQLGSREDNEKLSYTLVDDGGDNRVAQRVKIFGSISSSSGGLLDGVTFDTIVASYPDSITEVYDYKSGGISGTVEATVTVIYTNASKNFVASVVRT